MTDRPKAESVPSELVPLLFAPSTPSEFVSGSVGGQHFEGRPQPGRWLLEWEERPTSMNKYRTLHHHARSAYDEYWRRIFAVLAKKHQLPKGLPAIRVTAGQQVKGRASIPDPGACFPTVKAAIDGLRDAGVIAEDTGQYVKAITLVPPESGGDRHLFWIIVTEVLPTEPSEIVLDRRGLDRL